MEELVKTLQKQVADAQADSEAMKSLAEEVNAKLEAMEVENATLRAKLAGCKCGKGKAQAEEPLTATIGDKHYRYTGPKSFVFNGNAYEAEEAITDQALLQEILDLPGQSYLRELV